MKIAGLMTVFKMLNQEEKVKMRDLYNRLSIKPKTAEKSVHNCYVTFV